MSTLRDELPVPPVPPPPIRVASFNILAGRFGVDALARAIAAMEVDAIGLQEVDRGTRRAGGVDQLALLADKLGMHAAFGKAMDFDGGAYGVALLSRAPLERVRVQPLPVVAGAEPRVLLTARTRLQGQSWILATTHFSSARDAAGATDKHREQARSVAETLGAREGVVLLADLNTEARDTALLPLSIVGDYVGLELGPTYPARAPTLRLDHLLLSPDLFAHDAEIVAAGVSDHRALVARVGRRRPPRSAP